MKISTHTSHAGRDRELQEQFSAFHISTHTSHAGRDHRLVIVGQYTFISTHTSHAGRDWLCGHFFGKNRVFLLTRPMRDVTQECFNGDPKYMISTHTSHAGRDCMLHPALFACAISTHTSHAGRDYNHNCRLNSGWISTHTSHAGRDHSGLPGGLSVCDFYSHVPCGT